MVQFQPFGGGGGIQAAVADGDTDILDVSNINEEVKFFLGSQDGADGGYGDYEGGNGGSGLMVSGNIDLGAYSEIEIVSSGGRFGYENGGDRNTNSNAGYGGRGGGSSAILGDGNLLIHVGGGGGGGGGAEYDRFYIIYRDGSGGASGGGPGGAGGSGGEGHSDNYGEPGDDGQNGEYEVHTNNIDVEDVSTGGSLLSAITPK